MGFTRPGTYGLYQPEGVDKVKIISADFPAILASIEARMAEVRAAVGDTAAAAQGTAANALVASTAAKAAADGAVTTAKQASATAADAKQVAATAQQVANGIADTANAAKTTAQQAAATANGIAGTANAAKATAQAASDKADQAVSTANDARTMQQAANAAPDQQVADYAATAGTKTRAALDTAYQRQAGMDAATAAQIKDTGSATVASLQARYGGNWVMASDYGVRTFTDTDQTDALFTAFKRAQLAGAHLLLPNGVIRVDNPGRIVWRYRMHMVMSQLGTVIDASHATGEGAILTMDSTRSTPLLQSGFVGPLSSMTNVIFNGPTDPATKVDCVAFTYAANPGAGSYFNIYFNQCQFTGFRRQAVYGNNTWLIHWVGCTFGGAIDACHDFIGDTNCGESIDFTDTLLSNSPVAFRANPENSGLDVKFVNGSIDYCGTFIQAHSGKYTLTGVHLETGGTSTMSGNTIQVGGGPMFDLYSAASHLRTPSLHVSGGEIITEPGSTEPKGYNGTAKLGTATSLCEYVVCRTTTSPGMPPITVSLRPAGAQNAMGNAYLAPHSETLAAPGDQNYPVLDIGGPWSLRTPPFSYVRPPRALNAVNKGDFEDGAAPVFGNPSATATTPQPWLAQQAFVAVASIVTNSYVGRSGKAVKFSFGSTPGPTSGNALGQSFAARENSVYNLWFAVRTLGFTCSTASMVLYCFDAAGANLGSLSGGSLSPNFATSALNANGGTNDWFGCASYFRTPPGTARALLQWRPYGATGDLWISDIRCARMG